MRLICGHDAEVAAWVAARIPHVSTADGFGPHRAIGVADGPNMAAGIVYHNYIPRYAHCEISFAADTPRFATRGVIRGLMSVPFEQYECRTVSLLIPEGAVRVQKFVSGSGKNGSFGMGFVRRGCLPQFFDENSNGVVYTMTRKDYDRLRKRIG